MDPSPVLRCSSNKSRRAKTRKERIKMKINKNISKIAKVVGVVASEALVATAVITYKATSAVFDAAYQIGKDAKETYNAYNESSVSVSEAMAAEAEYKRIFGFDLKR